jgi:hypothetical protein
MASAAAIQNDTIWLQPKDYSIVSLNPKLSSHVPELARALRNGVPALPDNSRDGFYDVELDGGRSYIHIHDNARRIYLVAFSRN